MADRLSFRFLQYSQRPLVFLLRQRSSHTQFQVRPKGTKLKPLISEMLALNLPGTNAEQATES